MEVKQYYYLNGTTQQGPYELEQLLREPLKPDTLIWNETLPDWTAAGRLPELLPLFAPPTAGSKPTAVPPTASYAHRYTGPQLLPMPDSHLVWGILTTLLCCMPLGIVSIVYATRVSEAYHAGDYAGSLRASDNAKKWAMWSALAMLLLYAAIALFYGSIFAALVSAAVAGSNV